jgi:hypothetical protein
MSAPPETLLSRLPDTERAQVRHVYEFAARCHEGRTRKSGDPYITHPVAVAEIAVEVGLDIPAICAALLHDVIEAPGPDVCQLRAKFGGEIATLVEDITELDRWHDRDALDAADDRAVVLKVLDRLHNMRTLRHLDRDKQRLKSRQTLDVMVPLAERVGLRDVSHELATIARDRLTDLSADTGATYQALTLGALLLPSTARARYLDEWLGELDALPNRPARARFTLRVTLGIPGLAFALRHPAREAPTGRLLSALRWILKTDLRAWTPLTALVGWMIVATARTSIADAAVTLITVPPVLHAGVVHLRTRLGVGEPDETPR